jgi:hypothetical protein
MSVFSGEHTSDEAKMSDNGIDGFASQQQEADTASQGSTGPRTPTGKSRSKNNAIKHGLFSRAIVLLPDESQTEFDGLVKGLRRSLRPKGTLEDLSVDEIATIAWCRRRLLAQLADINPGRPGADVLLRCETNLGRAQDRALNQLRQAQDMRKLQSGIT